ncbi:hypothetical protein [Gluconobacter cerinus]|uniref:hypothetical protein n=1 Tax=Gluconobacter cerinus TaxID=38307 RepID=UPI001B8CA53A|nr:hypothetical protein [Gluconobacter cerinus]MBS0984336.1 hypothetical protein [Gluconobacter cerinus]
MFVILKDIISSFDNFLGNHSGSIKFVTVFGSALAVYKSILNTKHLRQQADIQRKIENNRYKLELFDKRFRVYTEFKDKVFSSTIDINSSIEILEVTHRKLKYNISQIRKCLLLFQSHEESKILNEFSLETENFAMQIRNAINVKTIIENKNHVCEHLLKERDARIKGSDEYQRYDKELKKNTKEVDVYKQQYLKYVYIMLNKPHSYNDFRHECEMFMESKLSAPEQAFDDEKGWIGTSLDYVIKTGPIHERVVMWVAVAACVLFLGVLLCS